MAELPHSGRTGRGPLKQDPRPKNRAVENENLQVPAEEGVPPLPATTPVTKNPAEMTADQKDQAEQAQKKRPHVDVPPHLEP